MRKIILIQWGNGHLLQKLMFHLYPFFVDNLKKIGAIFVEELEEMVEGEEGEEGADETSSDADGEDGSDSEDS